MVLNATMLRYSAHVHIGIGVQQLGCFNDRSRRALPDLIVNLRYKIDWIDMRKTVRECACAAREEGYKVTRNLVFIDCFIKFSLVWLDCHLNEFALHSWSIISW